MAQQPQENYAVDSASVEHAGVPKGEIIKCVFDKSAIYPGTWREYWIYVPKQYNPDKPACVYVNQDGIQWNAPVVFDNLIHNGEMPVTIGVFVMHGRIVARDQQHAIDRFNRSFEYDGLGDAYVKFITEEILPDVEKHSTSDGRAIHLSKSGNDRAIGGSSSGAVCAFTAAWERPQVFSRVFSAVGTYVGLRGADRYPTLIRKYEPRPIRVFLQDGSGDLNIYGGDWWKANEMMERALVFAGYEVRHVWGEGGHNGRQGTAVFPEAMRWLWKDWPKAVTPGKTQNQVLSDILISGENWELVAEGYGFTEGIAANASGDIYFQDIPGSKTYKIDAQYNAITMLNIDAHKSSGTAFGADGRRYVVAGATKQIIAYGADGKPGIIAEGIPGNDLAITRNGNIYVTSPEGKEKPGRIFLIKPGGKKTVVDEGLKFPNGATLSPDQTQLYVAESASHWIWAYTIAEDGTLTNKQRYGWLHTPDDKDDAWPDGLKCDTAGRIYVATRMGIQVLDQPGRVNAVLPLPAGQPSNCCFGGKNFDILYVSCDGKIFRRKLRVRGANSFEQPIKPPSPRL
ncbi:MAG: SMP-30/gluconolactonase/LRE family protein [Sphingobacteriales bacterium]|nr:SMP-30/gluconolactonase/LRE family protein [Sphingobacteriales bacterium]